MFKRAMIGVAALAAIGCGEGSTGGNNRPSQIIGIINGPLSLPVGTAVAAAPTFVVHNAEGDPIEGVPVTVAVTSGGGSLVGAPTSSGAEATPIGTWTLGTTAGPQSVTVSANGVTPLVITITAVPGPPAAVEVVEGNNQAAAANTTVPAPIRVRVRDSFNNGVPDVAVDWEVRSGGGSVAAAISTTNAQGIATAPTWTLGPTTNDVQTLVASIGVAEAPIVAVQSFYRIDLRFTGAAPSATVQAAFTNAANRLQAIIIGDLIDVNASNFTVPAGCVPSQPVLNEIIDDIIIYASMETIDGPGGVLGSAGPCFIRNSNLLTSIGAMRFDAVDLEGLAADGRLQSVITHEMLHVIGVGTLWDNFGLLADAGTPSVRFTGANARNACVNVNGGAAPCNTAVPAENCLDLPIGQNCGAGTINSHWKESIFQSELLTGYLGTGTQPLSAMTIQSLADLGYQVDIDEADAYTVPPPALRALLLATPSMLVRMPEPRRATHTMDTNGRVTPIFGH